jgi:hypothetical protein
MAKHLNRRCQLPSSPHAWGSIRRAWSHSSGLPPLNTSPHRKATGPLASSRGTISKEPILRAFCSATIAGHRLLLLLVDEEIMPRVPPVSGD